ncbi:MAG: AAA family ATPase [Candidatus Nanopelagicales bacterium]
MLNWLSISGYRSVLDVELRLAPVTVVLGGNGTGKTNLYRSLVILQAAARGRLAQEFAAEGGFGSALWAGPRKRGPVRMRLAAQWEDLRYELELGLPQGDMYFPLDPQVKLERITLSAGGGVLAERKAANSFVRDEDGVRQAYPFQLWPSESLLSRVIDPRRLPVLDDIRGRILDWRAYHQFRSDAAAPMRSPRLSCFTPVLDPSGDDLAAALYTVMAVGHHERLAGVIARAFPGCSITAQPDDSGQIGLAFTRPGLHRALGVAELSDGTLRFIALAVALLSPRPPSLLVLNEPETSLHEDMLAPLAELILLAARDSQIWVTTHSQVLAGALSDDGKVVNIEMQQGQTQVVGAHPLGLHTEQ